jgi:hypothetical protein
MTILLRLDLDFCILILCLLLGVTFFSISGSCDKVTKFFIFDNPEFTLELLSFLSSVSTFNLSVCCLASFPKKDCEKFLIDDKNLLSSFLLSSCCSFSKFLPSIVSPFSLD